MKTIFFQCLWVAACAAAYAIGDIANKSAWINALSYAVLAAGLIAIPYGIKKVNKN